MMPAEDLVEAMGFETSHTACAAFLVYAGHEIEEMVWDDFTCTFVFENTQELQDNLKKFVSGQARVEPLQYSNTFGQVTRRMREHPDNPRQNPRRRT